MFQKVAIILVLMPFIFATQAQAMELVVMDESESSTVGQVQVKELLVLDEPQQNRRKRNRSPRDETLRAWKQSSFKSLVPQNPQFLTALKIHIFRYFELIADRGREKVKNFVSDLQKMHNDALLFREDDVDSREDVENFKALEKSYDEYTFLLECANLTSLENIKLSEKELFKLAFSNLYLNGEEAFTFQRQNDGLETIFREMEDYRKTREKHLPELQEILKTNTNNNQQNLNPAITNKSIDILNNFYEFFNTHKELMFIMQQERRAFSALMRGYNIHNTELNSYQRADVAQKAWVQEDVATHASGGDAFDGNLLPDNPKFLEELKIHIYRYHNLLSKEGLKKLSNLMKEFQNMRINGDPFLEIDILEINTECFKELKNIHSDYTDLSKCSEDIKLFEKELLYKIILTDLYSKSGKISSFQRQHDVLEIIRQEMEKYRETLEKHLPEFKEKFQIFFNFSKNFIISIQQERGAFVSLLRGYYRYSNELNKYPKLIQEYKDTADLAQKEWEILISASKSSEGSHSPKRKWSLLSNNRKAPLTR